MTLDEQKNQLCDICHRMWQQGMVAANDGNVSARLPDGTILATPTGVSKGMVTPEMLVLLAADGQVLAAAAGYRPSSEMGMHLRCYALRGDVNGVVHAHPPTATSYAAAGLPLDDYSVIETVLSLGAVPVAPYATPSTPEVADSIAPFLPRHDALLLKNHGALTVGADVLTAYFRMESLEMFAKISLNTRLLGGAAELDARQVNTLLNLRENRYHLGGRHPGYVKFNR